MSDITEGRKSLVRRVLEGAGLASQALRRAAFERGVLDEPLKTLVGKVAERAHTVTDADVAAAKAAGMSEDQIFEVVVCAAIGQASREYDTALAALRDAAGGA